MLVRKPAVAGLFYPDSNDELQAYLKSAIKPVEEKISPVAIIVPHAGYIYSGATAASVYSLIESFDTYLIFGPNHTGLGADISLFDGIYEMPFGEVMPDSELIEKIAKGEYVEIDYYAHLQEHSIEVQLPFIDYISEGDYRIASIVVGTHNVAKLYSTAETIAKAIKEHNRSVLMVVSSDMNHYEDQNTTLIKDNKAIEAMKNLDENELLRVTQAEGITMCGVGSAYIAIAAAKMLGAKRFVEVDHRTSGEVNGDFDKVVGYLSAYIE